MITREQTRAARALIDWQQERLSTAAGIGLSTVKDFESGKRTPHQRNLTAIQQALVTAGIEFIAENGGGAGVRLRK